MVKRSLFSALLFFYLILPACKRPAALGTAPLFEGQDLYPERTLQTIAFGSCNRTDLPQQIWPLIQDHHPDLWIWLGDNIYADTENMDRMADMYRQQKFAPEYAAFRQAVPVIGIWDDHDYGLNDGGKEFPLRDESKNLLLDFLDIPAEAAVRNHAGAYQSYTFGPAAKQVKIILLDTRYFRDPLTKDPSGEKRYLPGTGDVLGEEQWAWLESELSASDARVHLICTSIQLIPEEHGFEKWANLPAARERFFRLLEKTQPSRAILLSGDRHLAEISRMTLDSLDIPLYEITSSGLTHSYEKADEPNRYRVGPLSGQRNFGLLFIDWSGPAPSLRVELHGAADELLMKAVME